MYRGWLAGISLGGLGSLRYASRYGHGLVGVLAIAPFLGEPAVIREISSAGTDTILTLWRWLHHQQTGAPRRPPIYLGFGVHDAFPPAHQLLAPYLPEHQVITTPGAHDWRVWQRLWLGFLHRRRAEAKNSALKN